MSNINFPHANINYSLGNLTVIALFVGSVEENIIITRS